MKKMKLRTLLYIGIIGSIVTSTFSCTKLKEEFKGELEEGTSNVDPGSLLLWLLHGEVTGMIMGCIVRSIYIPGMLIMVI